MKKILFTLSFAAVLFCYGQKMPQDYFEEATEAYEEEEWEEALNGFQYILEHYQNNELYPKALYNTGYIYFEQSKYDKAIPIFEKILAADFNEKESFGRDIMSDPYANYKHRASDFLSSIYYEKGVYDKALHYLEISIKDYPLLHFCGNAFAENDVDTALKYARIYNKTNRKEEAIKILLPTVFVRLADNSEVIEELRTLLKDKKDLINKLNKSIDEIYEIEEKDDDRTYTRRFIRFLDTEIFVPKNIGYDEFDGYKKSEAKEDFQNNIKSTDFYKMVENL